MTTMAGQKIPMRMSKQSPNDNKPEPEADDDGTTPPSCYLAASKQRASRTAPATQSSIWGSERFLRSPGPVMWTG